MITETSHRKTTYELTRVVNNVMWNSEEVVERNWTRKNGAADARTSVDVIVTRITHDADVEKMDVGTWGL